MCHAVKMMPMRIRRRTSNECVSISVINGTVKKRRKEEVGKMSGAERQIKTVTDFTATSFDMNMNCRVSRAKRRDRSTYLKLPATQVG